MPSRPDVAEHAATAQTVALAVVHAALDTRVDVDEVVSSARDWSGLLGNTARLTTSRLVWSATTCLHIDPVTLDRRSAVPPHVRMWLYEAADRLEAGQTVVGVGAVLTAAQRCVSSLPEFVKAMSYPAEGERPEDGAIAAAAVVAMRSLLRQHEQVGRRNALDGWLLLGPLMAEAVAAK